MSLPRPHSAKRTSRIALLAILATLVSGCQSIAGIQPFSQVRVVDASPDAPALDIYQTASSQTAQAGLYNVGFGTVSSYIPIASGAIVHAAYVAGSQQQIASVRGTLAIGQQYTLLAGNVAANLQMTVLKDQSTPAPPGQTAFRFLDQTTRSGPVDIYLLPAGATLAGASATTTHINFGGNTGYLNQPAGTYSIVALPAGASPGTTAPAYSGSQVSYPAGSVRTIILIDQQPPTASSLKVITADDYDAAS
jgi:hypothetical protein